MESNITKKNISKIQELIGIKRPLSALVFEESPLDFIRAGCIGSDGYFYVINGISGRLEKYENIVNESIPEDTGVEWDINDYGVPVQIASLPEGIVILSNLGEGADRFCRVYHLATINDAPQEVYESPKNEENFFSKGFGFDTHTNGMRSLVFVGVYGRGDVARDLLLSVDGGRSFSIVKKTKSNNPDANSHWHDVAIDPYTGYLWASEGDSELNRAIHFSDDLGKGWYTIGEGEEQPTAIIPFPGNVVFANDTGFVGLKNLKIPRIIDDNNDLKDKINTLYKTMPGKSGSYYYGESPIQKGAEAYIRFNIANQQQPSILLATGDFGESWYSLSIDYTDELGETRPQKLWAIDDNYVYALGSGVGAPGNQILYAPKIKWI